jgi:hypothetical protein
MRRIINPHTKKFLSRETCMTFLPGAKHLPEPAREKQNNMECIDTGSESLSCSETFVAAGESRKIHRLIAGDIPAAAFGGKDVAAGERGTSEPVKRLTALNMYRI